MLYTTRVQDFIFSLAHIMCATTGQLSKKYRYQAVKQNTIT